MQWLAISLFVVTLLVYGRTLAPSITWQNAGADSGDLVAAIYTGGIPHPPGYPLYTLLTQIFILFPVGSVAYRVNLFSAFSAALAVAVLFLIMRGLLSDRAGRNVAAAATALLFAFSPLFWSQATIAEVNTFHILLAVLTLGGLIEWHRALEDQSSQRVQFFQWIIAILLGLGIAHHPTIVLLLPAGLILLWGRVPTSDSSAFYRSLGRVSVRTWVLILGGSFVIALALYATLIVRALGNPPISWGDPRTLENLAWLVSGELYRGYLFGLPLNQYPNQLSALAKLLFDQFGLAGVALGLFGARELFRQSLRLAAALALAFGLQMLFAVGYFSRDSYIYLIPGFMIYSLWIAVGLLFLVNQITNYLAHRRMFVVRQSNPTGWKPSRAGRLMDGKRGLPATQTPQDFQGRLQTRWHLPTLGALLLLLPLANLAANFSAMDLSQDTRALDYGKQVFAAVPDNAVIIADGDEHIFALWYYRYVEKNTLRVAVIAKGLAGYSWYRDILRREYPEWVWSEAPGLAWDQFLQTLVANNLARSAFFWTDADAKFESVFRFERVGLLYAISPRVAK